MKFKKLFITAATFLICISLTSQVFAQQPEEKEAQKKPAAAEQEKPQQKITTPALQLPEEKKGEIKEKPQEAAKPDSKPPAATAKIETPEIESATTPIKSKSNIELILDASGSMKGLMGNTTKMEILKSVVKDVISQPMPEGAKRDIGLRVYGSQKPSEENDCKDTELLIPIGPLDVSEFQKKVSDITAQGVTPIGFALEEAAKDFREISDIDNVIILVADGSDSCNANICQIAEKLHGSPKKIIIHIIGFDIDQKANEELRCITENADGQLVIARSETELATSLEQVLMANIPYNLRIKVVSGATPIPSTLTVYKGGTKKVVREDKTSGLKFFQLPPGTYDIEVTYADSKEPKPPSKIIKNVEVQATSKAEQVVQFELGSLTLAAFDQNGEPTAATYSISKKEEPSVKFKVETGPEPYETWLSEGTYNVSVEAKSPEGFELTATAEDLPVTSGKTVKHDFHFQVGKLELVGKDSEGKEIDVTYRVTPVENKEKTILEGTTEKGKNIIDLPPGKYDVYAAVAVSKLKDLPGIIMEGIEIVGGETVKQVAEFPAGTLVLSAKDSEGKQVETLFTIRLTESEEKPAEYLYKTESLKILLPPGNYNIKGVLKDTDITPPPTINWDNVNIMKDQETVKEAVFKFGSLKLAGETSNGVPVPTTFYIFTTGEDEATATFVGITGSITTRLVEGYYDIRAEDISSRNEPKPNIWFHSVHVTVEEDVVRKAVFTDGTLKMICMGPNYVKLPCDYRVFSYGMDSPIFEGSTEEKWVSFDIPPGNYYIEAGYHDSVDEVLLKKWITIRILPNEMLEQIIRF